MKYDLIGFRFERRIAERGAHPSQEITAVAVVLRTTDPTRLSRCDLLEAARGRLAVRVGRRGDGAEDIVEMQWGPGVFRGGEDNGRTAKCRSGFDDHAGCIACLPRE